MGARASGPRKRWTVVLMAMTLCLVTAVAVSHVWTRLSAIELGYAISKATKRQAKLKEANRRLRIEVALLKNPERIARMAEQELGMQHPSPDQVRRLRLPATQRGTPRKARPATPPPSASQQLARAR